MTAVDRAGQVDVGAGGQRADAPRVVEGAAGIGVALGLAADRAGIAGWKGFVGHGASTASPLDGAWSGPYGGGADPWCAGYGANGCRGA